ncbi:hypothetical protein Cgig2_014313 [Carnegiea gigantea]|uniref:Aminotransferase-like plant mobile domain-containing protein n=1 Tax=Carnegiea gigantea TaxID=171969 RepID=A0A9Q1GGV5_9CARY|nr:hypothetical protein Cgig2_014313 [Carnegiea gigantea]
MDGTLGNERAPLKNGHECGYEPYYQRLSSSRSLNAIPSSTLTSTLVRKVKVKQGTLRYRRNNENKCVDVSKDYENYFNATVLEKVNTGHRGPEIYPTEGEFYPALHRLLTARRNWRPTFQVQGRSTFMMQGPLTNTLHHGAGEVGISLYNLERVGGLPILGDIYEEFLPQNKDLVDHNKYPAAIAELLRIHAELCEFHKAKHIYYDLWLDHFYQEYLMYFAYGEQTNSEKEKVETKKRSPLRSSPEGELATFLAFWLSCFVLPHDKEVIRPETFVMAALMASRHRISLTPIVLGYIYHGLGDAASNSYYPGKANTIFPIHYVIGWLAELFPCLYRRRPDSDCADDFPTLVCNAGLLGRKLSLPQARHIFKGGRYLSLRGSSYSEDSHNGRNMIDMGLSEEDSKFLLSIWSAVLPVCVGAELILEPYYPNRFARQFVFDQGVPSNRLSFIRALRQQRSGMDLAQAHADLQRRDTRAKRQLYQGGPSISSSKKGKTKEDWARESILKGVEVIIDIISNHGSARELLASRAGVFPSLSALRSMIDIYNFSIIEICWLSSKIEEIFGVVETAVKIKDLVDIDRVKALSDQDLTYSSEITHIEDQLNNLSTKGKLKSSLELKKKEAEQVKVDLVEAGFSKLHDLEKEKNHLKSLIGFIIFFENFHSSVHFILNLTNTIFLAKILIDLCFQGIAFMVPTGIRIPQDLSFNDSGRNRDPVGSKFW